MKVLGISTLEASCYTGALKAYKKSLDLHRQVAAEQNPQANGDTQPAQAFIPARLLNNAAVVFLACGKQREALDLVIEATQVSIIPVLTMMPANQNKSVQLCHFFYFVGQSVLVNR